MIKILIKILKGIAMFILSLIIIAIVFAFFGKDIGSIITKTEMFIKGINNMNKKEGKLKENKWEIYNFDDIDGETSHISYLGAKSYPSFGKYRMWDIKIFEDVGFILTTNENEIKNILDKKERRKQFSNMDKIEKAFIFRSIDKGKSFEKIFLTQGKPKEIYKKDNIVIIIASHDDKKQYEIFKSIDNGKTWESIYMGHRKVKLTKLNIVNENTFIFEEFNHNTDIDSVVITKDSFKTIGYMNDDIQNHYRNKGDAGDNILLIDDNFYFLYRHKLVKYNIITNEESSHTISAPAGTKFNILHRTYLNEETKEIYVKVYDPKEVIEPIFGFPTVIGFYFPMTKEYVKLPTVASSNLYLKVAGKYIGGFVEIRGYLFHVWTLNKGEDWNYEVLKDYHFSLYSNSVGVGYGQIWLRIGRITNLNIVPRVGCYLAMTKYK